MSGFRIGLKKAHVNIGQGSVGYKGFGGVKHVLVTVRHSRSPDARRIGTCIGFGQGKARKAPPVYNIRKVLGLLRCSGQDHVAQGHKRGDKCDRVTGIHLCQLLKNHGRGLIAQTRSAVLGRNLQHVEAHLKSPVKQFPGALALLVRFLNKRLDLMLCHIPYQGDQFFLFLGIQ